ncbi:unnamed protein product [Coregonus sp. 'balchen']|nr:unnamed protein product [Coregonus sp. 'balchen']
MAREERHEEDGGRTVSDPPPLHPSHIRQLMSQKAAHEKELEAAKDKFKTALSGILAQFEQIVSVFHAASKQKAWDHFSKAQRKNLDVWRKQAEVGPLLFLHLFTSSIHLVKCSIVYILLCPLCEHYVSIPISPVFRLLTTFCGIHGVVLAG